MESIICRSITFDTKVINMHEVRKAPSKVRAAHYSAPCQGEDHMSSRPLPLKYNS